VTDQRPKLSLAPRAGFEPATNRLTETHTAVLARLSKVHRISRRADKACICYIIVYYRVSSDNSEAHEKCCPYVV
jgi:hypothetical protein